MIIDDDLLDDFHQLARLAVRLSTRIELMKLPKLRQDAEPKRLPGGVTEEQWAKLSAHLKEIDALPAKLKELNERLGAIEERLDVLEGKAQP